MEEKEIIERIKENKKLPNEVKSRIITEVFGCILSAIIVYVYFIFLNLGLKNINKDIYLTDLRVFSTTLALLSVIMFEKSYKGKSIKKMYIGIEVLVLAIITLMIQYIIIYLPPRYTILISVSAIIFNIYYILKGILVYHNIKRKYKTSLSDIKEIVKKQRRNKLI